jgi:hypothetical protein
MKKLLALLVLLSFGSFACYTTYHISMDQLKELQAADDGKTVVETREGATLEITHDSRLFVSDYSCDLEVTVTTPFFNETSCEREKRWQLTPFNFRVTASQIVASDRDYIFMKSQLVPEAQVDRLSTVKTVGLIAAGVLGVGGFIAWTAITAGQGTFTGGN